MSKLSTKLRYDGFISYSHTGEAWVTETLLPRLEATVAYLLRATHFRSASHVPAGPSARLDLLILDGFERALAALSDAAAAVSTTTRTGDSGSPEHPSLL